MKNHLRTNLTMLLLSAIAMFELCFALPLCNYPDPPAAYCPDEEDPDITCRQLQDDGATTTGSQMECSYYICETAVPCGYPVTYQKRIRTRYFKEVTPFTDCPDLYEVIDVHDESVPEVCCECANGTAPPYQGGGPG